VAGIAIATAADLERALRLDAGAFAEVGWCRCWSGRPWHLRSVNLHAGARWPRPRKIWTCRQR